MEASIPTPESTASAPNPLEAQVQALTDQIAELNARFSGGSKPLIVPAIGSRWNDPTVEGRVLVVERSGLHVQGHVEHAGHPDDLGQFEATIGMFQGELYTEVPA